MLKVLNEDRNPVISSIFTASATCQEIQEAVDKINARLTGQEKVNWYIELEDIYEPLSVKVYDCFSTLDRNHVNRIAVVGERGLHSLMTFLESEFPASKVKFFLLQDQAQAHSWIAGKELNEG